MNDVNELKRFAVVHARAQGIPSAVIRRVFADIRTDRDGAPDSWTRQWCRVAAESRAAGRPLESFRYYNLARFPYPDGPARRMAFAAGLETFEDWARDVGVRRLDVTCPDGTIRCWSTGLEKATRRPALIVMGGVVSIKEQWAPLLPWIRRLGFAGIVAEMPGVGENDLRYNANRWGMLSDILDAVGDLADTDRAYALAVSFSGHLALRNALSDRRIRGVVTSGAPITDFFTDAAWHTRLPRITVDTLGHLTGVPVDRLPSLMSRWAISAGELAALDIPVSYLVSGRDEIVPPDEAEHLRRHLPRLSLRKNDDVHGSPNHTAETGLWAARSILRMSGGRPLSAGLVGMLLTLATAQKRWQTRVAARGCGSPTA